MFPVPAVQFRFHKRASCANGCAQSADTCRVSAHGERKPSSCPMQSRRLLPPNMGERKPSAPRRAAALQKKHPPGRTEILPEGKPAVPCEWEDRNPARARVAPSLLFCAPSIRRAGQMSSAREVCIPAGEVRAPFCICGSTAPPITNMAGRTQHIVHSILYSCVVSQPAVYSIPLRCG